jgi:hypothetical protein
MMYRGCMILTSGQQGMREQRQERSGQLWHTRMLPLLALFALLPGITGCQFKQSAFALTASNAGSTFAAAALTLRYAHEGKITTAYASSSFMNYQSQLQNVDQQLPMQKGAPDTHTIQSLLKLYQPAIQTINAPCLDSSCNWHAQIAALNRASDAFLKAGGQ